MINNVKWYLRGITDNYLITIKNITKKETITYIMVIYSHDNNSCS